VGVVSGDNSSLNSAINLFSSIKTIETVNFLPKRDWRIILPGLSHFKKYLELIVSVFILLFSHFLTFNSLASLPTFRRLKSPPPITTVGRKKGRRRVF